MSAYIGIDLGTTFSAAATLDETGRLVMIKNPDEQRSDNLLPSAVWVEGDELIVGEEARKRHQNKSSGGVASGDGAAGFKKDMGDSKMYKLADKAYSPTDLSAAVLKKLKMIAEKQVGDVVEAVVTTPANFSNEAREETMAAARKAGLNSRNISNEPTAAALYYAATEGQNMRGTYAVYDLGGGTFDVSIIRIDGENIEVLASNGVKKLGGDYFDEALIELVADKFKQETGRDINQNPDNLDYRLSDAEADKISLSNQQTVLAGGGESIDGHIIKVTRSALEEKISSYIAQTEMLCESTVEDAGLTMSDIQGVLLAGGSTRMPWVSRSIQKVFGKEPIVKANVDEVVALGAAFYVAYKNYDKLTPTQQEFIDSVIKKGGVQERTSKYYGIISLEYDEARETAVLVNSIIIHKGEKIPCSQTKTFFTVTDGQTSVNCKVTESDRPVTHVASVDDIVVAKKLLGNLPPNRSSGQKIEVTFSYDENQTMRYSFVDIETGLEVGGSVHPTKDSGDSASDLGKILVD
ncbi:MAG: Hsp70 family protein [Alphaproteobacteria bacterium GM202ARS2]|nr:Hsp70 family protein [Alphaproteobacteria bacterium GM202ARS2]